jgi:hypothetical protein
MVASANYRHDGRRIIVVVWLFAGMVFSGAALTAGRADASCGDYLLHGPSDFPSNGHHRASASDLAVELGGLSLRIPSRSDSSPESPTSSCANGRCQSAPALPPANSPTRAVYIKQPLAIDSIGSLDCQTDASHWLFPADGLRPEGPSLAVDLPPPKRFC